MIPILDMHCDTISEIRKRENSGLSCFLLKNSLSIDLEKMKKGGYSLQVFAIYVNQSEESCCFEAAKDILKFYQREMHENKSLISPIHTFKELEENEKQGRLSALLSLEEGAIYQDSLKHLAWFQEQGVRMATFTWNYENELGYPNQIKNPRQHKIWSTAEERGLKEKGFLFLEEMERLHIIADVSHLSDGGFLDIAHHAKRPFLASHSNARGLVKGAARNLTDEMIRLLAQKGGIMGLNFAVSFLRPDWNPDRTGASVDEMVQMARYITNIGGIDCLGLGSDFDGIEEIPELSDCSQMQILAEKLHESGFSWDDVEKICGKNVRRFLKENL